MAGRGRAQGIIQPVLYLYFCLNHSLENHQQGQESGKRDESRTERRRKEDTRVHRVGGAEEHRAGSSDLAAAELGCFPYPRLESGFQAVTRCTLRHYITKQIPHF